MINGEGSTKVLTFLETAGWAPKAGQTHQISELYANSWQRYAEDDCSIGIHGLLVNLDYLNICLGAQP